MVSLTELWLPILLSGVFVFIASTLLHMVIPIHKGDFKKLPGEDAVLEAMRSKGIKPGTYMFPCAASMKDMGSPEMIEKCKRGPVGFMTVVPSGAPGMGKNLVQWFVFCLLVALFVAYIAMLGLERGDEYMTVFRLTGTAGILGFAMGAFPESIWKGQSWGITAKFVFDGVVYGLVTAGTFGWLWPAA
jgi:hypothetical protein